MSDQEQLERSIAALQVQRELLGDDVVDASIAALRDKLAALHEERSPEPQRKQVTVLFADVSGFTALSEGLDAEDLSEVMNRLWHALDRVITRHGGRIDKHMGDGVMALWGSEMAREDDPEQAVRAALAMHEEVHHLAHTVDVLAGVRLRIGLNTGPVLLGAVGSTGEYTAMGDAVNVAARLEQQAPLGGVLIARETHEQVRDTFETTAQAPLLVKGKSLPLHTFLVTGRRRRSRVPGNRGVVGVRTRMIGRRPQLEQLCTAVREARRNGRSRSLSVVGDAGVGKSRLRHEFASWLAGSRGAYARMIGKSRPEMRGSPRQLWRDLFMRAFDIHNSDTLHAVRREVERRVAPVLGAGGRGRSRAHVLGHFLGFDFSDSPDVQALRDRGRQLQRRALEQLVQYFRQMAGERPLILQLEDLHWADDSSLDIAAHLARQLAERPVVIVGFARPTLYQRRPAWDSEFADAERVALEPLSRADSIQLVHEILQRVDNVPAALEALVERHAEGNPFYVEEFIKILIDDGVVEIGAGHWQVHMDNLQTVRVPTTLTGLLQARLDGLPADERLALQQASVIGRVFWDDALARVRFGTQQESADRGPGRRWATGVLACLCGRELVFERKTSTFAGRREFVFKHALLREVAYESVLKRDRRVYHERVANWLIDHSRERDAEYAGMIAGHLERVGARKRASDYLWRAARQANERGAYREAAPFLQRAAALISDTEDRASRRRYIAVQRELGRTLFRLGDNEAAQTHVDRSLQTARAAGDAIGAAAALNVLGHMAIGLGQHQRAIGWLRESMELAREHGDMGRLGEALFFLGWIHMEAGDFPSARSCMLQSRDAYARGGHQFGLAQTLNGLGSAAHLAGDDAAAIAYFEESLALSDELGDRQGRARVLTNMGGILRKRGDLPAALSCSRQALQLATDNGFSMAQVTCGGNLGHVLLAIGDLQGARACYRDAMALGHKLDFWPAVLELAAGWAQLLAASGHMRECAAVVGFVAAHPALLEETRRELVVPMLGRLRGALPPGDLAGESASEIAGQLARGRAMDIQQVLTLLDGGDDGSPVRS